MSQSGAKIATIRVTGVRRAFDEPESVVVRRAARSIGASVGELIETEVKKKSLDRRGKPSFVYSIDLRLEGAPPAALPEGAWVVPPPPPERSWRLRSTKERVIVVGAGPAGLFCALELARAGLSPVVLDRGQPVEVRGRHVSGLMHRGELDPESNICFGEGGAGTWSDGKLYTRVRDERIESVLETIVRLGGPRRILTDGRPHLGTDKLVALCKAFRAELTARGASVRFGERVDDLIIERGQVRGVSLAGGERLKADRVVLASGHSGREIYLRLHALQIPMERKPFAVGFRVEHPQALINQIQYGRWASEPELPTADYRLAANFGSGDERRGVYSFCMCPGGQIVPSATRAGAVCVNGMSHASRRGHWANSALVVTLSERELAALGPGAGLPEVLCGMGLQEEAERRAYEAGGGGFIAPAQRLTDFAADRPSPASLRKTTYKPGVAPADLGALYPSFVTAALRRALPRFAKKMPGFLTDDALLIGVETRTSAPVRVLRDAMTLSSPAARGLYPCGEGSGYGGGIMSSAIDGLRVAERVLTELEA